MGFQLVRWEGTNVHKATAMAVLALMSMIAVACGSDSDSGTAADTGSDDTTEGESPGTSAEEPTGEPLVFGTVSLDSGDSVAPEVGDGIELWESYINANGGIEGRPVEIERCDEAGDATEHERCIRGFIDNRDMVGVIPGVARHLGGVGIPLLEEAQMPILIPAPQTANEFNTSVGLALTGGLPTTLNAISRFYAEEGLGSVVLGHADAASLGPIIEVFEQFASDAGLELLTVPFPPAATDFVPTATAMSSSGGEGSFLIIGTNAWPSLVQALETVGFEGPMASLPSSFTQEAIDAAGAAAEGVYTTQSFPFRDSVTDADAVALFDAYYDELEAAGQEPSDNSLAGFVAGFAMEHIVEQVGADNLTRESLLDFLLNEEITDVPLLPDVVSRAQAPDDPAFSALANPTQFLAQVEGGEIVVIGDERVAPFE